MSTRPRRVNHRRIALSQLATEFHLLSRSSVGARTLLAALRIQGVAVGRFLAGRLMKQAWMFSLQCRKHRYRRVEGESAIAANELNRKLTVSGPNQVWCDAVMSLTSGRAIAGSIGWQIMGLYACCIVGWVLSNRPGSRFAARALRVTYS